LGRSAARFTREVVPPITKTVVKGAPLVIYLATAVTSLLNHRQKSHGSIELHPAVEKVFTMEQYSMGIDPNIWATVHGPEHHRFSDATLYPFYKVARAVHWLEQSKDSEVASKVAIPETFPHQDPYVEKFTLEDEMRIGDHAIGVVKDKLGEDYREPSEYSIEELNAILHPTEPQYYYEPYDKKKREYSQEDIARILLTDPHSPSLQPLGKGTGRSRNNMVVQGIKNELKDYKRASNLFKAKPHLKPENLQREGEEPNESYGREMIAGFVVAALGTLLIRNKYKKEDAFIAAAVGSALNGIRMGTAVVGGMVINVLGHASSLDKETLVESIKNNNYRIKPRQDGSVATNTANAGAIGKGINVVLLDEGEQAVHHQFPQNIAYTRRKGLSAFIDAPFGSAISFLANSKFFPLIKPGKGVPLDKDGRRTDMKHGAVEIIELAREVQMKAEEEAA